MQNKSAQQYAKASHSHNLRSDATHHHTDMLAAIALSSELGSLLFSVKYANQAGNYNDLRERLGRQTQIKAALYRWPAHINHMVVAKAALDYWLNDLCQLCEGRGNSKVAFTDTYSDVPCVLCDGSGKKPIPANRHIYAYVAQMVRELERMEKQAGDDAIKKLAA